VKGEFPEYLRSRFQWWYPERVGGWGFEGVGVYCPGALKRKTYSTFWDLFF